MNRIIDKILLCVLWILAVTLFANFWFYVQFGFNIMARGAWWALSVAQSSGMHVSMSFYLSLIAAPIILLIGIYVIMHPKFLTKKHPIRDSRSEIRDSGNQPPITNHQSPILNSQFQRPQMIAPSSVPKNNYTPSNTATAAAPTVQPSLAKAPVAKPAAENQPSATGAQIKALEQMAAENGWTVKPAPGIHGAKPSLFAIGADESLLIGIICPAAGKITAHEGGNAKWKTANGAEFTSPVLTVYDMVDALQELFKKTLPDIPITVRAFVWAPDGEIENADAVRPIWDAFSVAVLTGAHAMAEYLNTVRPRALATEDDREDFAAYAEYIDTAAGFFENTNDTE